MAPSRLLPIEYLVEDNPPPKRLRLESEFTEDDSDVLPSHPLGVRPEGNAYTDRSQGVRQKAGRFSLLPDELLMHFLEYLNDHSLLALGSTCKALYAFSYSNELWRALFIQYVKPRLSKWQIILHSHTFNSKVISVKRNALFAHKLRTDCLRAREVGILFVKTNDRNILPRKRLTRPLQESYE